VRELFDIAQSRGAHVYIVSHQVQGRAVDRAETLTLYQNPDNKGDNRLYPDALLHGGETVEADTLDNICRQHGIDSVSFIKIDVQGAEAKVMRGARGVLRASSDCILMTEFWPYGLAPNVATLATFLRYSYEQGLSRRRLAPDELFAPETLESFRI